MDFPYGGDPAYRVSLLDKNEAVPSPRVVKLAVPSPRVVKLAVAFQLSGPGFSVSVLSYLQGRFHILSSFLAEGGGGGS